jgi:hypothetical protein
MIVPANAVAAGAVHRLAVDDERPASQIGLRFFPHDHAAGWLAAWRVAVVDDRVAGERDDGVAADENAFAFVAFDEIVADDRLSESAEP